MPGERFSRLYLRTADLVQDSARARYRIAGLFRERVFSDHAERLTAYIGREIGIRYPGTADIRRTGINSSLRPALPIS